MSRNQSLTDKSISGLLWSFTGVGGHGILQTVITLFLARLLSPEAFGLVGAAMIVINFSQIFSTLGVSPAIVQHPNLNEKHIHAGFLISICLSIGVGGAVFFFAPHISIFFKMDGLTNVIQTLSLIFPIIGLSVISEALLQKKMKFKKLAVIKIVSYVVGYGIIGINFALLEYGVWSLVFAQLGQVCIKSITLWYFGGHTVSFNIDISSYKELFDFGGGFSLATIGNYGASQGDNIVVGRWLNADALGIYTIAYKMVVMPARLFGTVVDKVLFPAMSSIQNDITKLRISYLRAIGVIAMIILPLSMILIITAPEIISFLLGDKWYEVTVPFQILSISMIFRTSYKISDTLAGAVGVVYKRAWRQWVYGILIFLFAIFGVQWGLKGVATGIAIAITVNFLLMIHLSISILRIKWTEIGRVHLRYILITMSMGILLFGIVELLRKYHFNDLSIIIYSILFSILFIASLIFQGKIFKYDEVQWLISLLIKVKEKLIRLI